MAGTSDTQGNVYMTKSYWGKVQADYRKLQTTTEENSKELDALHNQCDDLKRMLGDKDRQSAGYKKQLDDLKRRLGDKDGELARYKEELIDKGTLIDDLNDEIETLKKASPEESPPNSDETQHIESTDILRIVQTLKGELATHEDVQELRQALGSLATHTDMCEVKNTLSSQQEYAAKEEKGESWWQKLVSGKPCEKCPKLEKECATLKHENTTLTQKLRSHSDKTNDEFRRFQGESQDGKDAEKMFRGFFRDTVETMLPGSSIRGPKLRDRSRVTLCKMFMDVNGQVQREIVSRVTNCFQLLFMPGKKQEESDSDVLRAFSILLGVPSVAKPLLCQCLSAKGVNDFKKAYAGYNQSADILGFLGKALDVNMALCTRVPPCLPTIMHPPYNEDIHEVRPPYEMDQGQQALYIRPILLADYRNSVLIRGMVIPANAKLRSSTA